MNGSLKENDIVNPHIPLSSFDKKDWVFPSVELLAIDETQNGAGPAPESSNGDLAANS